MAKGKGPEKPAGQDITDGTDPVVVADEVVDVQSRPDVVSSPGRNADDIGEGHDIPPYSIP